MGNDKIPLTKTDLFMYIFTNKKNVDIPLYYLLYLSLFFIEHIYVGSKFAYATCRVFKMNIH